MKNLRIFLCALFMIFCFSFVGCDKPNDPNTGLQPPPASETTTFDILKNTSSNLNTVLTTEKTSKSFAVAYSESFYDLYINQALTLLNSISSMTTLTESDVLTGNTVTVENSSIANKIEKFYLKNNKNANKNIIDLTIFASKEGYDLNPLNFILIDYDIEYDTSSNQFIISCRIEDSSSQTEYIGENTSSSSKYYYFNYDSKYNFFIATHFYRTGNFDYTDDDIFSFYIMDYDCINYDFQSDIKIYPSIDSDLNLSNKEIRQSIQSELNTYATLEEKVEGIEVDETATATENLSEQLIPIIKNFQIV